MEQRRVVIIHDGTLISEGLVLLVQSQPNLEAVVFHSGDPDLLEKVRRLQSEVVVVPSYDSSSNLPRIAQILKENPGARVISFGLEKTEINAYHSEGSAAASLENLLAAIQQGG